MATTGALVLGRYRLVREIGAGGAGVVWQATDTTLGSTVALKRVSFAGLGAAARQQTMDRTLREARLSAKLRDHQNVVCLLDVGIADDAVWLVLEYLPSQSLSRIFGEHGPLPPGQVAAIGSAIAAALGEAHARGIQHRDVTPGNVLVGTEGQVKLTDFGIAHGEAERKLTESGVIAGTVAYMAPEVARGAGYSTAADIYGLGATLYSAVEGTPPYGREPNPLKLLNLVMAGEVPEPGQAGELAPVLLRALDADPAARPDASTLRAELAGLATELPESLVDAVRRNTPRAETAPEAAPGRRRWPAALVLAAVLASVAVLVGVFLVRPSISGSALPVPDAAGERGSADKADSAAKSGPAVNTAPVPAPQRGVRVALSPRVQRFENPNLQANTDYPTVTGLADPSVQRAVNDALAAPVADEFDYIRYDLMPAVGLTTDPSSVQVRVRTTAKVLLQTDSLVSVVYSHKVDAQVQMTGSWDAVTAVTVDLRTGHALTPQEIFLPGMQNTRAMARLVAGLDQRITSGLCQNDPPPPASMMQLSAMTSSRYALRALDVAFGRASAEFNVDPPGLGFAGYCESITVKVPYDELTSVLSANVLHKVTGGT